MAAQTSSGASLEALKPLVGEWRLLATFKDMPPADIAQIGDHWTGRLTIFARDHHQKLRGGVIGFTDRGWLRLELLGVLDP